MSLTRALCFKFFLILSQFCIPNTSWAKPAILLIHVGAADLTQFKPYLDIAEDSGNYVSDFIIKMNVVGANHHKDYEKLDQRVDELTQEHGSVLVFGYSIGGKFAAKLLREHPDVKAAFLMDPVDGGPPFLPRVWPQFPIFMQFSDNTIEKPTWILETEHAQAKGSMMGIRCVNEGLGAQHFVQHVQPKALNYLFLEEAGHLQLILPPKKGLRGGIWKHACPEGEMKSELILAASVGFWQQFLEFVSNSSGL